MNKAVHPTSRSSAAKGNCRRPHWSGTSARLISNITKVSVIIWSAVAVFPVQFGRTATFPSKRTSTRLPASTARSRAMTSTANHGGRPTTQCEKLSVIIAASSSPLSAMGSKITPNSVRWFQRRATQPSSPSLAEATLKAATAHQRNASCGMPLATLLPYKTAKRTKTGMSAIRPRVIWFAVVISGDWAAQSETRRRSFSKRRVCALEQDAETHSSCEVGRILLSHLYV